MRTGKRRTENTMAKRKRTKGKGQRTNNNLQNITHKTKDPATRTPLKTGGEPRWSGRVGSSCSTCDNRGVTLVTNLMISY